MRYLPGTCKRCKTIVKFDIGDMTKDEALDKIKEIRAFECPGFHVYIAGIHDHYRWGEIQEETK